MTYIQSNDGTTVDNVRGSLPRRLTRKLTDGTWSTPSPDGSDASDYGYYPLTEVPQPDADHVRSIVNTGPGAFTETWTFDQAVSDANADNAARDADQSALGIDFQDLKDKRDNAQTRFDTITGWADIGTVSRTGNQAAQITALQDKVDELAARSNQFRDQVRFAWGRIRQLYITAIRMIRAQRYDI